MNADKKSVCVELDIDNPVALRSGCSAVFKAVLFPKYMPSKYDWPADVYIRIVSSAGMTVLAYLPTAARLVEALLMFHLKFMLKYVTAAGGLNVLNWYETTTPKFEPAPRRAQKRSGFWLAEQFVMVPLARTTVMAAMPSTAKPYLCELMP